MALARRGQQRFSATIWPGFVDAMTALLLVLMFVLTIFMIVQSMLRETISTQDTELDQLSQQVADLGDALGLERARTIELETTVAGLTADLTAAGEQADAQSSLIATLTNRLDDRTTALAAAETRITDFEAQVARLLIERDTARGEAADLTQERANLQAILSDLRAENASQSASLTDALAALTTARAEGVDLAAQIADLETNLTDTEKARLAEAAAAQALRERLQSSEDELTAMTLALEEQRRQAEETLTLLAGAEAARDDARAEAARNLTEAERRAGLLAAARLALSDEQSETTEAARKLALLNEQITALRSQLGSLQAIIDDSAERDEAAQVQIEALGSQLNTALARVASEQQRRAELEAAERRRLEEETKQLERYRSEFFGKLSELLAGRDGVRVVGDRFVFSSEVLFETGSAVLAAEGRAQIAGVVEILSDVAGEIPAEIDWIVRVDGHTDNLPLSGTGRYRDNWELSQARALSVVRYMQDGLGFPPERLAATGFAEYRPVAAGDTPEARAQNRRIELKLTER